jgi:hypothetical protein
MSEPSMGLVMGRAELEAHMPTPVLPRRPDLVNLYWHCWELAARMVRHGTAANGFADTYVDAAFGGNIFQWDTCFIAAFARYSRELLPVLPALDNFYRRQDADGHVSREYRWENGAALWAKRSGDSINPPLLAWAEWQCYRLHGQPARLHEVWPALDRYYRYLRDWHRIDNGLYWITDLGSGMDNTPRFAAGWADLSCQQALNATTMARIATEIGDDTASEWYAEEHRVLARLINDIMWDEADGFYWDVDANGAATKAKTVAGFWALLGDVAAPQQVARLVEHLRDPASFWRTHPFPTLAADHPMYKPQGDYWRGAVWAPTNYMIIKGLRHTRQTALAREAALRHVDAVERVYRATGTVWENYRADEDAPGVPARPDFVGWTGCGPIALLLEEIIGVEVDAHAQTVRWNITEGGSHGVLSLPFADGVVDLLIDADDQITVRCTQPLTLEIEGRRGIARWTLEAGHHQLPTQA